MPNPKTALRVGLAAVAIPGALAAMAAPAANAAELAPAAKAADTKMADTQHSNLSKLQNNAVQGPSTKDAHMPDMSNQLNGKTMDLGLPSS
jgi:hypothetical protein